MIDYAVGIDLGTTNTVLAYAPLSFDDAAARITVLPIEQLFDVGAPVVLWNDPGGYNAYRVDPSLPNANVRRLGSREQTLSDDELRLVTSRGWTLDLLQQKVDQFVLHYDVAGTSRQCFKILHELRGLSVHFMLDLDGTIYQTCDL